MSALRKEQKPESAASGDRDSSGVLSAPTRLSVGSRFGSGRQSGHPGLPTNARSLVPLGELEGGKLKGEIELDEAYFGGRRKGKRGRAAAGKSVVFGLLERESRVYTKVVESVSAEELMRHIQAKTRKGSVYYTDAFRGYQSLKRYGKHHTINHSKAFVSRRQPRNHINGIEGFWSYAKHILYHYRGVSKYYFPMYLKEIEYRFNHRTENLFKRFLKIYFGYVSP